MMFIYFRIDRKLLKTWRCEAHLIVLSELWHSNLQLSHCKFMLCQLQSMFTVGKKMLAGDVWCGLQTCHEIPFQKFPCQHNWIMTNWIDLSKCFGCDQSSRRSICDKWQLMGLVVRKSKQNSEKLVLTLCNFDQVHKCVKSWRFVQCCPGQIHPWRAEMLLRITLDSCDWHNHAFLRKGICSFKFFRIFVECGHVLSSAPNFRVCMASHQVIQLASTQLLKNTAHGIDMWRLIDTGPVEACNFLEHELGRVLEAVYDGLTQKRSKIDRNVNLNRCSSVCNAETCHNVQLEWKMTCLSIKRRNNLFPFTTLSVLNLMLTVLI